MESFYGRKNEMGKLDAAFSQVRKGKIKTVLITGPSGVGKTALVSQFAHNAEKNGAIFIRSKADTMHTNTPYAAISICMGIFIKKMIAENPGSISKMKKIIFTGLNNNISYAISLVPELKYLFESTIYSESYVGKQEEVNPNLLLLSLLEAFVNLHKPIILFLDDLQWIDTATVTFLKHLALNGFVSGILLVMSHRSSETEDNNNLKTMPALYHNSENTLLIELAGLPKRDIKNYLKNLLKTRQNLTPLSDICHQKTAGNPFYLTRMVEKLLAKEAISKIEKEWVYDISFISTLMPSENVADLVIDKIHLLSLESILLLKHASCQQSDISIKLLQITSGFAFEKIEALLWKPLQLNFIQKKEKDYLFSHDKILEALESLLTNNEKIVIHKRIGQFYLVYHDKEQLSYNIFTILYHYSFYYNTISDLQVKKEMTFLYLMAGKQAQSQTAHAQALKYFITGKNHWPGDIWKENYELALNFCNHAAQCSYLSGQLEITRNFFTEVGTNAVSFSDQLPIEMIKITYYSTETKPEKSLKIGLNILKHLGVNLSDNPSDFTILSAILKNWIRFIVSRQTIRTTKQMNIDTKAYKIVKCISALGPIAITLSPKKLLPLTISTGFGLSLKHGNFDESSFFYVVFGMILNKLTGSVKWGRKLRAIAKEINQKYKNDKLKGKEMFLANAFLDHWDKPLLESSQAFEKAEQFCLRNGEYQYYAYNTFFGLNCLMINGTPLESIRKKLIHKKPIFERLNNQYALTMSGIINQTISNFQTGTDKPWVLEGVFFNETKQKTDLKNIITDLNLYKFCSAFFCGRMDIAYDIKKTLKQLIENSSGTPTYYYFYFLTTLVDTSEGKSKKTIEKRLRQLKKYALYNREVYQSKYLIARGEFLRLKGDLDTAAKLYTEAAAEAKITSSLYEQAFAIERLGVIAKQKENNAEADDYFKKAVDLYKEWGLIWKHGLFDTRGKNDENNNKEKRYSDLYNKGRTGLLSFLEKETISCSSFEIIDKTLYLMQEITNADCVHVIIKITDKWKSIINIKDHNINRPVVFTDLPEKILTFAEATQEALVVDEKNISTQLFDTFYLQKYRPLSFILIPCGKKKCVYFENYSKKIDLKTLTMLVKYIFSKINMNEFPIQKTSKTKKTNIKHLHEYCEKLQQYMMATKRYKKMDLSLKTLSMDIQIPQRTITDATNKCLGQNFHSFVNSYRIEEVKQMLKNPENSKQPILDIAFAAGFSSKSSFNDIFKKNVGTTPTKFRAANVLQNK
ncbi:MAG: AAA family ATPase [Desulfobacteraceae bacterium]|nr:AAA family ATPase [Desulfobacteraceae bacterium]